MYFQLFLIYGLFLTTSLHAIDLLREDPAPYLFDYQKVAIEENLAVKNVKLGRIQIPYYLVPKEMAIILSANEGTSLIDSFEVIKKGKAFLPYPFHLQDGFAWNVKEWLSFKGIDATLYKKGMPGYWTESSSMFIKKGKKLFSVKTSIMDINPEQKKSTDPQFGYWEEDKARDLKYAKRVIETQKYVDQFLKNDKFHSEKVKRRTIFIRDPEAIVFPTERPTFGDQIFKSHWAVILRDLSSLDKSKRYLPAFVMHTPTGKVIAQKNGAEKGRESDFWSLRLASMIGSSTADALFVTNLELVSNHLQNWMIEFDKDWKLTGRLALKDYLESGIHRSFQGKDPISKTWDEEFREWASFNSLRENLEETSSSEYQFKKHWFFSRVGCRKGFFHCANGPDEAFSNAYIDAFRKTMVEHTGDPRWNSAGRKLKLDGGGGGYAQWALECEAAYVQDWVKNKIQMLETL